LSDSASCLLSTREYDLVAETVVVEVKAVETLLPIHEAQLLTYLRLGGWKVGLLINFNVPVLKRGVRRLVLGLEE
jgi:GxxExxY protein